MVKRPMSHVIEDRSRARLRLAIPSQWIVRDKYHDYGIDAEVEIFDESGNSTGFVFLVQIKGTSSRNPETQCRLSLRLDSLAYYKSLELPVLLVRWAESTNLLYARWAHSMDRYYARKGAKTMSVKFCNDEIWTNETPFELLVAHQKIRLLKSPGFALPLQMSLAFDSSHINGVAVHKIRRAIRRLANATGFVLVGGVGSSIVPSADVLISRNVLNVSLAGITGCTVHGLAKMGRQETADTLHSVVFLCLAVSLDQIGHHNLAAQIATKFEEELLAFGNIEVGSLLAGALFRTGDFERAMRLSEALIDQDPSGFAEALTHVAALLAVNEKTSDRHRRFLQDRIKAHIVEGDPVGLGVAHYNMGNYLRRKKQLAWAFHHYRKAQEHAPTYLEKGYFLREFAGILFTGRRFSFAAEFYRRALEFGETGLCEGLFADALMFAGRFAEARERFKNFNEASAVPNEEFLLKEIVLSDLIKFLGNENQNRQPAHARMCGAIDDTQDLDSNIESLEACLKIDALSGLTWFNLGVLYGKIRNHDEAAMAFILAGLSQTNDVEAWRNAFLEVFNSRRSSQLLIIVVLTAHFFVGAEFMEDLEEYMQIIPDTSQRDALLGAVDEILESVPSMGKEPIEIRFFDQ